MLVLFALFYAKTVATLETCCQMIMHSTLEHSLITNPTFDTINIVEQKDTSEFLQVLQRFYIINNKG